MLSALISLVLPVPELLQCVGVFQEVAGDNPDRFGTKGKEAFEGARLDEGRDDSELAAVDAQGALELLPPIRVNQTERQATSPWSMSRGRAAGQDEGRDGCEVAGLGST